MGLDIKGLFRDPDMFKSNSAWQKAGFEVRGRGERSDIMVASHPSTPGVLFKKYSKKIRLKDQRRNYQKRIKGADKLRALIAAQQLTRIIVPQKQLHELPSRFSRKDESAHVLVVDRLDLLDGSDSKQQYGQLDDEGLRQLCVVLCAFSGLDSGVRNLPFTSGGQIAFVDTERWESDREREVPLRHIRAYLSDDQRAFVDRIFKKC